MQDETPTSFRSIFRCLVMVVMIDVSDFDRAATAYAALLKEKGE